MKVLLALVTSNHAQDTKFFIHMPDYHTAYEKDFYLEETRRAAQLMVEEDISSIYHGAVNLQPGTSLFLR